MIYDHIIIGGGCAGLQLARALVTHPVTAGHSVLILDATSTVPVKSWCFWMDKAHAYSDLVEKSWDKLSVTAFGSRIVEDIQPFQYQYISSERFYEYHYTLFKQHPQVQQKQVGVQSVVSVGAQVHVTASDTTYVGHRVYDSRLPQQALPADALKQHFLGWFVEAEPPCFSPDTATLMDFDIEDDTNTGFCYVLPFSEHRALVEMTFFTQDVFPPEAYKALLQKYLMRHYPGVAFTITQEEVGQIPMTSFRFTGQESEALYHIGTSAGMTKASTGYTFMRILRDSEALVDSIASGTSALKKYRGSTGRFWFYDTLLIGILTRKPFMFKRLMYQLFRTQPFKKVLLFLDERTHLAQEAGIFIRLPIRLFLHQVWLSLLAALRAA